MARLKIGLAVLVLIPVLLWGGFRIWLVNQEPEFRNGIESFSTLEFIFVMRDHLFPQAPDDRASFGRRAHAGRGGSPWVLRSNLDGRPRMLSLALAPNLWLAYSTQTATVHRFWRGDIDFTGPVYDAQHGNEPTSRGHAFFRAPEAGAWRVREGDAWNPARVQWRGHGFDPSSGAAWLRYDVMNARGEARTVTEWPELTVSTRGGGAASATALERRFAKLPGPGPSIALAIDAEAEGLEADASLTLEGSLLVLAADITRIVHEFDAPSLELAIAPSSAPSDDAFATHDCLTCHNERERIVGPAWSEIALRHEGANLGTTVTQLATRIVEGSVGQWGSVPMTPHPDLTRAEAEALVLRLLETEPAAAPRLEVDDGGATAKWSYGFNTEPRPESLHPSLTASRIDTETFTPRVGGLAWLPDGRLAVTTWDRDGSVFAIEGWDLPPDSQRIERIAEGLQEPLGLAAVGDALYVMQKQELTQLVDANGDGWTDEYRTISNDWRLTSNFHEFGFGLGYIDRHLYGALSICVLRGGKSCRQTTPDRGKVFRVSLDSGELEFVASGLRTPNGVASTPDGRVLITDNQGDWLPASKLIVLEKGAYYGWRAPGDTDDHGPVTPPTLWLPQNEVGNSPTQPLALSQGPYAGDILFGDVFNGGLKRASLEEVGGRLQGAAFHFSGGLQAPVNRLIATRDGDLIAGQVGSGGNWGEFQKQRYGLELLRFGDEPAFEPMHVAATPEGFDIEFSRKLAEVPELRAEHFRLSQWFYVPAEIYGGPKYDETELPVSAVEISGDRRVASLKVPGLKPNHVVYLNLSRELRSDDGEQLWINEAWYTLNALQTESVTSKEDAPPHVSEPPETRPNTLTASERAAGWRLLFDGVSFAGWKNYAAEDEGIEGWVIEDGALKFTRDVSFAGLIWNHINPMAVAALDLMTEERFANFELSVDWKISPGGNSGVFYLVPDEEARVPWDFGLEMQILDDAVHTDGKIETHRTGGLYDLTSSPEPAANPVGEWNTARIRVEDDHIEHWLNGVQVVDITRGGPEWNRAMAASKFAGVEGFGMATSGHFTLQDHGDIVWFRSIKLRELDAGETAKAP